MNPVNLSSLILLSGYRLEFMVLFYCQMLSTIVSSLTRIAFGFIQKHTSILESILVFHSFVFLMLKII